MAGVEARNLALMRSTVPRRGSQSGRFSVAAAFLSAFLAAHLLLQGAFCSEDLSSVDLSTVGLSDHAKTGLYLDSIRADQARLTGFFFEMPKGAAVCSSSGVDCSGSDWVASLSSKTAMLRQRAAGEGILYLEVPVFLRPENCASNLIAAEELGGNLTGESLKGESLKGESLKGEYLKLEESGLDDAAQNVSSGLKLCHDQCDCLLGCNSSAPDPGCGVAVRYLLVWDNESLNGDAFSRMALAFDVAGRSSLVSGVSRVLEPPGAGDCGLSYEGNILNFLHGVYPDVEIRPSDINISKRSGSDAPIEFVSAGVPFEVRSGMARADGASLAEQFALLASSRPELNYSEFKRFVRDSLENSSLSGNSLWASPGNYSRTTSACAFDSPGPEMPSPECSACLEESEKARTQWTLECKLAEFERSVSGRPLHVSGEVEIIPGDVEDERRGETDLYESCSSCG